MDQALQWSQVGSYIASELLGLESQVDGELCGPSLSLP